MPNRCVVSVTDTFERALAVIQARVAVLAGSVSSTTGGAAAGVPSLAVAYSGGLDSSALLHMAHRYAIERGIALFAFHIHHCISPNADAWLQHCKQECARLGIGFDARRVYLGNQDRDGTEQAARISRYAALGDLCRTYRVPLLLTAHHQDDQAETVLLQMLRGSGVAGMSGMEIANNAPGLLGDRDLVMARPLLNMLRTDLERFVSQQGIRYVEDESNADFRYARNALRHKVMPSLATCFPGFQERIARAAQHPQSAQRLLNVLAAQDLAACLDGPCIDIGRLEKLAPERVDNLLRYWLALHGARMPAAAWLEEMRVQLLQAKDDAQVRVTHADCEIRRYRNRIHLTPRMDDAMSAVPPLAFHWCGEAHMDFPSYGGSLYFDAAKEGVDAAWLRGQELQICRRSAGQKLKLALNRPSRSLKQHYQALNIPAWERLRLPVITAGGRLLFAAGIGMNWQNILPHAGPAVCLRWKGDAE